MGIFEDIDAMFRNLGRGSSGGTAVNVNGLQRPTMSQGLSYEAYYGKDSGKPAPVR